MLSYILGDEINSYIRPHIKMVLCAIILTIISTIFVFIPAFLLQPFIDEGMKTGQDPVSWKIPWIIFESGSWLSWQRTEKVLIENISPNKLLMILTLVGFISVLCKSLTIYLSELSAAAFANQAVKALRIDFFQKLVDLPLSFHHQKRSGELISRATSDITVMQDLIVAIVIGLIKHPVTAFIFLLYLLYTNLYLTLLVFAIVPVMFGLTRLFGQKVKKHAINVQSATANLTDLYQETLICLKIVHGFFKGDDEIKKFSQRALALYKDVMNWYRWDLGLPAMMDITSFMIMPLILIVAKIYFHHSLGEIVAMGYAFSKVYSPLKKLAQVNNNLRTLQGSTKKIFEIMAQVPEIRDPENAVILPRHQKLIEFHRVSFAYNHQNDVLKDISFQAKPGEMIAFVGSSGNGKSTLLDLLPRYYDITKGSIRIDGIDIKKVSLESLRKQIGIVSQEIILFHDTIANNIAYGNPNKDIKEIIAAAKSAYAHDFILAQPQAYNTIIGDQGCLLSGGQRQRLSIARAILIDPSILILDEAASALDAENEQLLEKAIDKLRKGRTVLLVAHRLSTIVKSNQIFVLEKGRIIEKGSWQSLLDLNGRFRQLYDIQFKQ